jgi:hypothetical protein
MWRYWLCAAALAVPLLGACGEQPPTPTVVPPPTAVPVATPAPTTATFVDSVLGIAFEYPLGWSQIEPVALEGGYSRQLLISVMHDRDGNLIGDVLLASVNPEAGPPLRLSTPVDTLVDEEAFERFCEGKTDCTTMVNPAGIKIVKIAPAGEARVRD